jgi:hypothetical protein
MEQSSSCEADSFSPNQNSPLIIRNSRLGKVFTKAWPILSVLGHFKRVYAKPANIYPYDPYSCTIIEGRQHLLDLYGVKNKAILWLGHIRNT